MFSHVFRSLPFRYQAKGFYIPSVNFYLPLNNRNIYAIGQFVPICVRNWIYGQLTKVWAPDHARIYFYGTHPEPWYVVWALCQRLGIRRTFEQGKADLIVAFEDKSYVGYSKLSLTNPNIPQINLHCTDIRKTHVQTMFHRVFGYPLQVDPLIHSGPMVCKSDNNGAHDGRILIGPIKKAVKGFVYQRLILTEKSDAMVEDIRVPIVGDQIPFVYVKRRPASNRFCNENSTTSIEVAEQFLSRDEITKIKELAQKMNLELGSMDVLRDQLTSKIYIVDVNKTCMGPPIALTYREKTIAIDKLALAFAEEFLPPNLKYLPRYFAVPKLPFYRGRRWLYRQFSKLVAS